MLYQVRQGVNRGCVDTCLASRLFSLRRRTGEKVKKKLRYTLQAVSDWQVIRSLLVSQRVYKYYEFKGK